MTVISLYQRFPVVDGVRLEGALLRGLPEILSILEAKLQAGLTEVQDRADRAGWSSIYHFLFPQR